MNITRDPRRFFLAGALIFTSGFMFGSIAGYFWSKKEIEEDVHQRATEEIMEVKTYYKKLLKTGVYSSPVTLFVDRYPDEASDDLKSKIDDLGYDTEQEKEEPQELLVQESPEAVPDFRYVHDDKDLVIEHYHDRPYVISTAEFVDEESEDGIPIDKITITYFAEDDTLSDEREEAIPDIEGTVGTESLTMFGVKSDDNNIVYVRNEMLHADFEVILDERSYTEVVFGYREKQQKESLRRMREEE